MIDIRSQPISEGSNASTDDEIYDRMLDTRPYYISGLGYGITAPSSSRTSRADIHSACEARLMEMQRQTVEDRQQTQELAAHVDDYQYFQI